MQEIFIAVNDNGEGEVQVIFNYDMSAEECKAILEECLRTVETRILEEDDEQLY